MKTFKSPFTLTLVFVGVITFILTSQRGISGNGNSGNGNSFNHHYAEVDFSLDSGQSRTLTMPVIDQNVRLSYTMLVPSEAPGGISFADVSTLFSSSNQTLLWQAGSPIDGELLGFLTVHSGTNGTFTLENASLPAGDTVVVHIAYWY